MSLTPLVSESDSGATSYISLHFSFWASAIFKQSKDLSKDFQTAFLCRKDEYLILATIVLYAHAEHTI